MTLENRHLLEWHDPTADAAFAPSLGEMCEWELLVEMVEYLNEQYVVEQGIGRPRHRGPGLAPIQHGSLGGFFSHRRRGSDPCEPCRAAFNLVQRSRRRSRRKSNPRYGR